jgi:hypothetical protein
LIFKADYLTTWDSFFDDLILIVNTRNDNILFIDMYLRIMNSIDQEVVAMDIVRSKEETARNSIIVCFFT